MGVGIFIINSIQISLPSIIFTLCVCVCVCVCVCYGVYQQVCTVKNQQKDQKGEIPSVHKIVHRHKSHPALHFEIKKNVFFDFF